MALAAMGGSGRQQPGDFDNPSLETAMGFLF
jgi:hypothetical protein